MPQLGLNIDHVATLREARYRDWKRGLPPEPNVLEAARLAEQGGAQSITVHLREDRRHIQPADVRGLSRAIQVPLNLEMAATPAMVRQALLFKPDEVCLVPENRQEVTTEGGLDVVADERRIKAVIAKLRAVKIGVSAFIDADLPQIDAAHRAGAFAVELHTGHYANATTAGARRKELARHARAAAHAANLGLQVNAGHGLHYTNVRQYIEDVPHLHTLNIGHSIVSRAIQVGLRQAVAEMVALLGSRKRVHNVD
ncbi:MAG TPA: pyridoxine 5'-phosphate synthase [Candidatus Methylacidiphilales bacterium]|nr:pyridoxine 5'-phosphate synthase [Candidatus Methylacidiphilales bacterium]